MVDQEDYYTITITKDKSPGCSLQLNCCANRSYFEIDEITTQGPEGKITLKISELEEEGTLTPQFTSCDYSLSPQVRTPSTTTQMSSVLVTTHLVWFSLPSKPTIMKNLTFG